VPLYSGVVRAWVQPASTAPDRSHVGCNQRRAGLCDWVSVVGGHRDTAEAISGPGIPMLDSIVSSVLRLDHETCGGLCIGGLSGGRGRSGPCDLDHHQHVAFQSVGRSI